MKHLICITLFGFAAACASAQNAQVEHAWTVRLKVVDDSGQPIANANAGVGFFYGPKTGGKDNATSIDGLTDTNGIFTASHPAWGGLLSITADKAGYYGFRRQCDLGFRYDAAKWNIETNVVLKRMIQPIPMYAKRVDSQPPVLSKPLGYDLTVGDWVAPNGKGVTQDIIFTKNLTLKSAQDYEANLTISFPNPGDGIQLIILPADERGSAFKSSYEGPLNGYEPKLTRVNSSHPGKRLLFDYDPGRCYFFRVRTVLDEKGNVKSAQYGKIYGDFMQFSYYLNPTPNDRNIEFDPKRNLLTGLKVTEQVNAP